MTLQQASEFLDISKKRLWRAVKSGQLEAYQVQRGARWEYRVSREQLDSYKRKYLDSLEMQAVGWSENASSSDTGTAKSCEWNNLLSRLHSSELRIRELEALLEASRQRSERVEHALKLVEQATLLLRV